MHAYITYKNSLKHQNQTCIFYYSALYSKSTYRVCAGPKYIIFCIIFGGRYTGIICSLRCFGASQMHNIAN